MMRIFLRRSRYFFAGLLAVGLVTLFSVPRGQAAETNGKKPAGKTTKTIQVKWLLAHEPADVFRRAAGVFAERLKKESNGEMELVVLTPKDFGVANGNMSVKAIMRLLANDTVQLSQTFTTGIGEVDEKFNVFDLPFLFRDHEHARKVLEGPVGKKLLARLDASQIHGLAFTYSGGFRVIPSHGKALKTPDDFKGLKIRSYGPVANESMRLLGAIPLPPVPLTEKGDGADGVESTFVRVSTIPKFETQYINETGHSLFLTSILASRPFFESLSKANREALERSALGAARIEREDSLKDGESAKAEFAKKGVQIVEMSKESRAELERRLHPVYEKFETMIGRDLIDSIVAQK